MNDTQQWYASTTIQGGVIALLDTFALLFHLSIGNDLVTQLVSSFFALVAVGMVIWGRVKAVKPIAIGATVLK